MWFDFDVWGLFGISESSTRSIWCGRMVVRNGSLMNVLSVQISRLGRQRLVTLTEHGKTSINS